MLIKKAAHERGQKVFSTLFSNSLMIENKSEYQFLLSSKLITLLCFCYYNKQPGKKPTKLIIFNYSHSKEISDRIATNLVKARLNNLFF